jgi:Icc-related predicted phosphoesterase
MRLAVMSDLHVEHKCEWDLDDQTIAMLNDCDAVAVAGDVSDQADRSIRWLGTRLRSVPVLYTPGNHDIRHPKHDLDMAMNEAKKLAAQQYPNVSVLYGDVTEVGGVTFIGTPLWTDFDFTGMRPWAMRLAEQEVADYISTLIRDEDAIRLMRPDDALRRHYAARQWLRDTLSSCRRDRAVVITHHAPHPKSLHDRFQGEDCNSAFVSDMEDLILEVGPALWLHGHTHDSFDYQIGATRVICNPKGHGPTERGKPSENPLFQPLCVVEL